jgi:hypothetical protein
MTYTNDTHKELCDKAMRTKWPYKKHTHASLHKIYEMRGRVSRKIRMWVGGDGYIAPALNQYLASRRIAKRVTSRYGG